MTITLAMVHQFKKYLVFYNQDNKLFNPGKFHQSKRVG